MTLTLEHSFCSLFFLVALFLSTYIVKYARNIRVYIKTNALFYWKFSLHRVLFFLLSPIRSFVCSLTLSVSFVVYLLCIPLFNGQETFRGSKLRFSRCIPVCSLMYVYVLTSFLLRYRRSSLSLSLSLLLCSNIYVHLSLVSISPNLERTLKWSKASTRRIFVAEWSNGR